MSLIKGETVKLIQLTEVRKDSFGASVYNETQVEVSNVLIGTPSSDQVVNELSLHGKKIAFVLGIPKGDTHNWKDTFVVIRGERFRTYGFPLTQTDANVPGEWNTQVKVEHYE